MANTNTTNTSITVSFQAVVDDGAEGGTGVLELEVAEDDQPDKDTTFYFGDNPIFRQYKSPSVTVSERIISDDNASIGANGSGTRVVEEEIITFSNSNTASTQYPIKSETLSVTVLGGNIGSAFAKTGPNEITATSPSNAEHPVGVAKVSYYSDYTKWKLSGVTEPDGLPDGESYPVLVYVFGTVGV